MGIETRKAWVGILKTFMNKYVIKNMTFLTIIALIFAAVECHRRGVQLEEESQEHAILLEKYEKSKKACISVDYYAIYEGLQRTLKLRIYNTGDKLADSIWLSQKIYLRDTSGIIYECDLPRYSYIMYKGSMRHMFQLEAHDDTIIEFDPQCFTFFRNKLLEKYNGQFALLWQVDYNQKGSPVREHRFSYYILNRLDEPATPSEVTGGNGFVEDIENYEKYGDPKLIKYVREKDCFFINPPDVFYEDSSGEMQFLYPDQDVPKGTFVWIYFPFDELVKASGSGYRCYIWNCDSEFPGKVLVNSAAPCY
jgi:hypothetical protein